MLARDPRADRAARLADDIVAESDRMSELIADLLELSRLDDDRRAKMLERVDLAGLVEAELASDMKAGRVRIITPPVVAVAGSPRQLRRVVRNLVDNAERHADDVVEVSLLAGDGFVILAVDDDGVGVAADHRQAIFERFSRLDEARGRDAGGSGLGLALVKAIADNHRGTVAVEDSALGGARFVVTLPMEQPDGPLGQPSGLGPVQPAM